jgi:hypothetical protein
VAPLTESSRSVIHLKFLKTYEVYFRFVPALFWILGLFPLSALCQLT